ncbi:hypothetical protein FQN60_000122 [Etheostoma spectabile]|uniref:Uncharacterized protein n=1 Tax=Etheostoma spectabile TaxID=54343 RepID=A0A5J5CE79_9PERO|nr:hypothetical protein FQN60_000122 [Etheostoma spectabile]
MLSWQPFWRPHMRGRKSRRVDLRPLIMALCQSFLPATKLFGGKSQPSCADQWKAPLAQ